jgi:23S rRNA (cytosine1962-C5)-methyltransferase
MIDPRLQVKYDKQAEMLANKVKKQFNHLRKRYAKQHIDVYRLYDWDIPEIRAVVDWYAGHLVLAEYARQQSTRDWLPKIGEAVARAMGVRAENLHLKERRAGIQDGTRYTRLDTTDEKIIVSERDLRFYVNLNDYIDTGLFADHRNTRQLVRDMAPGKDFLNLYCYTGSFSCYAAKGGARSTVSVDRSETAISWVRENMDLNGIPREGHHLVQADTLDFLKRAVRQKHRFDLAVVDPPSYSTTRSRDYAFDIARDYPTLLSAVVAVMKKGGTVFFSTNHQKFDAQIDGLSVADVKEITAFTIPEDYQNKRKKIHRCWRISV